MIRNTCHGGRERSNWTERQHLYLGLPASGIELHADPKEDCR
jgi:hypothetical protein